LQPKAFKHEISTLIYGNLKFYFYAWFRELTRLKNIKYTGRFIMFSVITHIYNNNNCSQPQENWKVFFWQLGMFDMCTTGDTAHIDTIFKFKPHTHQHLSTWSLHTLASPSDRSVNYDEKQITWKKKFWVLPSICRGFVNTCPTVFL
jgi:hypothetical protein